LADEQWNSGYWDAFRQWMTGGPPFDAANEDFRWITEYVDGVVKDALTAAGSRSAKRPSRKAGQPLSYELFQTHHHLIVRFRVPERIKARRLRVFAGVQKLRVEGLPGDEAQTVELPAFVSPSSCRALFKDGVLQVKLAKRKINDRFEEVFIRFE